MKSMKRTTSLVLALLLVLSSSFALAADFDLKVKATGEQKDFLDWSFDDDIYLDVVLGEEGKYLIESGGSYYKAEDVVKASEDNPKAGLDELVKDLTPVDEEPADELKVVEVSAITKEVFAGEVQLEFAINGESKATDVAKLREAGYTVDFQSTITVDENGKVNATGDFKYNVIVTKDDKKFETGITSVKVITGTKVTKINKVVIEQPVGKEVSTVVVGEGNVKLVIKEYVDNNGKVVKDTDITDVKLVSKNPEVLVVMNGELMPVQPGKATVQITKDGMETYELVINVVSGERKATTIEGIEDLSLAINAEGSGESKTLELTVKDQYGDKIEKTIKPEASTKGIVEPLPEEITDGKLTVTALSAGTTKVTLTADEAKVSFNVTVKKAEDEIVSYHLEIQDGKDAILDLNEELVEDEKDDEITVKLVGRDKNGLLVKELTNDDDGIDIKSSDESIVTYTEGTVEAVKVGKAKIVATVKENSLVLAKVELPIEVINTTKPKVEKVELGKAEITNDGTVYTVGYDKTAPVGKAYVEFNHPVKVSVKVGGVELSAEELAKLIAKTGENLYDYVNEIEANIGSTYEKLEISGSFTVEVELENQSGYTTTYTFNFKEAE